MQVRNGLVFPEVSRYLLQIVKVALTGFVQLQYDVQAIDLNIAHSFRLRVQVLLRLRSHQQAHKCKYSFIIFAWNSIMVYFEIFCVCHKA